MKFKIGDQVVCIHKGPWTAINNNCKGNGPKFNEICTIGGYVMLSGIRGYEIVGYEINHFTGKPAGYTERWFEPLITDKELYEQLETIQEPA